MNAAHEDYVQVLVETGLIGFAAVVWFIVEVCRTGLCGAQGWNHNSKQGPKKCPSGHGENGHDPRPEPTVSASALACLRFRWGNGATG